MVIKNDITMKIKEGYLLREIAGNTIVVPVGEACLDFNGMINLNESGAFLWKILENGADAKTLLNELVSNYDVSEQQAKNDIENIINELYSAGVLDVKQND